MSVYDSTVFRAHQEFLTPEEGQLLFDSVSKETLTDEAKDIVKKIADAVEQYNDDLLGFDINLTTPVIKPYVQSEGSSNITLVPDHAVHAGNIVEDPVYKISVIVNVSSRDEVQGGELVFKHWAPPARIDNFGAVIAEGSNTQPEWTNEQGTVVFHPSMEQVGYQLVTSGPIERVKLIFKGPKFK